MEIGGNLADVINVAGPGGRGLSESKIWEIFFQVCQGVALLHEQTPIVIHRDIKAENVLITEDGKYKLCDFGSAKREMVFPSNDSTRNAIQEDIDRFTTMVYRSPEMVDLYMEKWIGDKVDIWALGCLLFKMAYVVTPFEEAGRLGILNARVDFPQTLSSASYSEELRSTIKWMLAADPEERPNIYDVLERVAKLGRTSWSRKGKVPPQHPPYPNGFGSSNIKPTSPASSFNPPSSGQNLFDSLVWSSSESTSPTQRSGATPDAFFPTSNANDFFSTPSPSTPIQFVSSPSTSDSSWATFGNDTSHSSQTSPNFNAFDTPTTMAAPQQTPTDLHHKHVSFAPSVAAPTANRQLLPGGGSSSSSKSHRRSVSDSSALTASLATMQLDSGFSTLSSGFGEVRPQISVDISRIPPLLQSIVTPDLKQPSLITVREILTYTWAIPKQQHVSKIFQCLAPKLSESTYTSLKSLYLVHRLITEGSDLVLTLCVNKLDFFKQLASQFVAHSSAASIALLNHHYSQYLVKKLEFHQAFEACFEGSYSLDMYFARLRTEGKKLQIGASDSPLRRQAVPALLDLQSSALALLEQFLIPVPNQPDQSSLKVRLCLPIVSDLCAILLLLQYVTTKLLATKTDFTKAITQYEEQYFKMVQNFAKLATVASSPLTIGFPITESAWAQRIKIPTLAPAAPAIVKGSTTIASPPSLDHSISATPQIIPNALIYDPISESELNEASALWSALVVVQNPSSSPLNVVSSPPPPPPPTVISVIPHQNQMMSLHHSMGSDPGSQVTRSQTPTFDAAFERGATDAYAASNITSASASASAAAFHSSSTPTPTFNITSSSSSIPRAYTPPPVFSNPLPVMVTTMNSSSGSVTYGGGSGIAPSFDPFFHSRGGDLSLSASGGFTQGDPFLFSTSPAISPPSSISGSGDFGGPGDFGAFSSSSSSSHPIAAANAAPHPLFIPSTSHGIAASFDSDIFSVPQVGDGAAAPKRQLASSVDHGVSSRLQAPSHAKGHKKRPSDGVSRLKNSTSGSSVHSSSGGSSPPISSHLVASGSDGTLTSEEKLKNKDQLNVQAAEFVAIQSQKGNNVCFDCGDVAPKWISLNLGIFICYRCSGVHRSFGTHISKVRSCQLDVLSQEQIDFFKQMGNRRAAKIWLVNLPEDHVVPDRNSAQSDLEKFLRDKYVFEEFKVKAGDVNTSTASGTSNSSNSKGSKSKRSSHTRTMSHQ
jgi:serine/threonine protein kinase